MKIYRRNFLKISGTVAAACLVKKDKAANAATLQPALDEAYGCLVDTTLCVGCRKCEQVYQHVYESYFGMGRSVYATAL